jgi:release factor glutamine methyltransferase
VGGEVAAVASLIDDATTRIAAALGLAKREARLEARVLAAFVWNVSPAWLIAHDTDPLADAEIAAFQSLVARRVEGVPIAYLVGTREFYGRLFQVSPDVLIPRPETELLVEQALAHLPPGQSLRVLDLGTGSGCIGVSIAREPPHPRRPFANCPVACPTQRPRTQRFRPLAAKRLVLRAGRRMLRSHRRQPPLRCRGRSPPGPR